MNGFENVAGTKQRQYMSCDQYWNERSIQDSKTSYLIWRAFCSRYTLVLFKHMKYIWIS